MTTARVLRRQASRRRRSVRRDTINGLLFISPWLIGLLLFTAYPVVASLYYSFTDYRAAAAADWIGLRNYTTLIHDPMFTTAVRNTLYYTALYVPLTLVISLGLAMLLNINVRGIAIYRTLFFVPYVLPQIGVAMLWAWILHPQVGLANAVLDAVHLPTLGWLSDPEWSKPSLVMMDLWASVGGSMVIFLAGLRAVPRQLYEAVELDGAGPIRKARHIMLPMLTPTIFYNLVLGLIFSLQVFTTVYVVTGGQGGPTDSTMFYGLLLYLNAFRYFNFGYASAMAWLLFIFIFAITFVLFRTSRRWVYYEGETSR